MYFSTISMSKTGKVSALIPDENNANLGTRRGGELLKQSLEEHGAGRSILVDKHNRIIAGNKTKQAALEAGLEDVVFVETDGTKLIAVKRIDLDLYADSKARSLSLSDNRIAELSLSWCSEQLLVDIDCLTLPLWTEQELALLQDAADLNQFEAIAAGGTNEPEEQPKAKCEDKPESDLLPFHVLLTQQQRERLFQAIKEAKSRSGCETTAEALDVIVQEYLNG